MEDSPHRSNPNLSYHGRGEGSMRRQLTYDSEAFDDDYDRRGEF